MTKAPLVGAIRLVRTLPCLADPGKLIVIGETDATIDGVMPLLNAILPNVLSYHPFSGVMTLRRRPGLITLYPDKVMITQVAGREEGLALLCAVRDLVNQTWARRDEIEPRPEGRRVPRPLDVYDCRPVATAAPAAKRPAWRSRLTAGEPSPSGGVPGVGRCGYAGSVWHWPKCWTRLGLKPALDLHALEACGGPGG